MASATDRTIWTREYLERQLSDLNARLAQNHSTVQGIAFIKREVILLEKNITTAHDVHNFLFRMRPHKCAGQCVSSCPNSFEVLKRMLTSVRECFLVIQKRLISRLSARVERILFGGAIQAEEHALLAARNATDVIDVKFECALTCLTHLSAMQCESDVIESEDVRIAIERKKFARLKDRIKQLASNLVERDGTEGEYEISFTSTRYSPYEYICRGSVTKVDHLATSNDLYDFYSAMLTSSIPGEFIQASVSRVTERSTWQKSALLSSEPVERMQMGELVDFVRLLSQGDAGAWIVTSSRFAFHRDLFALFLLQRKVFETENESRLGITDPAPETADEKINDFKNAVLIAECVA
jgi:hypothetical protein